MTKSIDPGSYVDVIHSVDAIFWQADARTLEFEFISQRAETLLGYPIEHWLNEKEFWATHLHPDDRDRAMTLVKQVVEAGHDHRLEYRFVAADGREVWIRDVAHPCRDAQGQLRKIAGVMLDVTEQKRAEAKARETERQFSTVFHAIPEPVLISTLAEGHILDVNASFQALFGLPAGEIRGRTSIELGIWVNPRERSQIVAMLSRLKRLRDVEVRLRTRSGQVRNCLVSAQAIELGGTPAVIAILRDITESKALEENLSHARNTEAISRLAAGVAQDIGSLITEISKQEKLLQQRIGPGDPLGHVVDEIHTATARGNELVASLLSLSRELPGRPRMFDLNALITRMDATFRRAIAEGITFETDLGPSPLKVEADPIQLEQVILNLLLHACESISKDGILRIRTASIVVEVQGAGREAIFPAGRYVQLEISNIVPERAPESFPRGHETYFLSEEELKDKGPGLSMANGIVQRRGGWITVSSEVGRGSVLTLHLPQASS